MTLARMKTYGVGKRVALLPHLDRWMMGDRYGEIVDAVMRGEMYAYKVKLDKSGKTITFFSRDLEIL